MFGELPKLFGRDFAIGYFLPVAAFLALNLALSHFFGLFPEQRAFVLKQDILLGATVIALLSWLLGVVLAAVNRDIYRVLEGYGSLNPLRLLSWLEKRRYNHLATKKSRLNQEFLSCRRQGREPSMRLQLERQAVEVELAERFPDDEAWVLPTPFGNTIRAFEVYPKVMYGLDDIPGWNRLLAIIPKDYREQIDAAKAQTDFWVNTWVLGACFVLEYLVTWWVTGQFQPFSFSLGAVAGDIPLPSGFLLVLGTLAYAILASWRAPASAIEWGDLVKSAYDVFLMDLNKKLTFKLPSDLAQERQLWEKFSQAIIYRLPSQLPDRDIDKSPPKTPKIETKWYLSWRRGILPLTVLIIWLWICRKNR